MTGNDVSVVQLSNDIEWIIDLNKNADAGTLAREIADDLMSKYTISPKPSAPQGYEDKPRGGGVW